MHVPLSTATDEASPLPESFGELPESSSVGAASGAPLEDPLPEELPLEEPPLDVAPPESWPPPDAPSGAPPSLDSTPVELAKQAGARGAVTSAKPQMKAERVFMPGALSNSDAMLE
jgi:hypothetical protein